MALDLKKEYKSIAKHSMIYGFGNMVSQLAAFILLPVYTRFLTPHDYGIKELVTLSVDVIGILLATAISSALFRFYFEYEETATRNEVVSSALITIGGFGIAVIGGLFFLTKSMAALILDDATLYYFFNISLATLWFSAVNNIGLDYLRANQRSGLFILLSIGKLLLAIAFNIYLICFRGYGVLGVLISNLITAIILFTVLIIPLIAKIGLRFSRERITEMLKFGLPLIPSQLGGFLVHLSDRFFIKGMISISDAGIYSLGYRLGALPSTFVSSPFNQVWLPRRLEIYKQPNAEEIFGRIFTYFIGLMIFAGLGVSALARDILVFIADPKYWEAHKIVPLIVIGTTIFTLHYHFNMGIYIQKKTKYLAYINASNGVLVLALNYLLIGRYGIYGAAYATIVAFLYKVIVTYWVSSRYYKIHFEAKRISTIAVCAAAIYAVCAVLPPMPVLLGIGVKCAILFCLPVLLHALGFYNEYEKEQIAAIFKRGRLLFS